jgi:MFS family permease
MTTTRLLSLTAMACTLAWVATAGEGLVLVVSFLSGWCSDSSTEAECSSQQSGATAQLIILTVIVVAIGAGLLFLAIRGLARPRVTRERWYLAAAVGMLAMPAAAIAGGLAAFHAFSHPGGSQAPGWAAALTIQLALLTAWALALDRITAQEMRREASAPDESGLP